MRELPCQPQGRARRQRWRLFERWWRLFERWWRLRSRAPRDVQRHVLELRARGPGPLPTERQQAGVLQRLLPDAARKVLTDRTFAPKPGDPPGFIDSRAGRPHAGIGTPSFGPRSVDSS